jgi:hypothetical protein
MTTSSPPAGGWGNAVGVDRVRRLLVHAAILKDPAFRSTGPERMLYKSRSIADGLR